MSSSGPIVIREVPEICCPASVCVVPDMCQLDSMRIAKCVALEADKTVQAIEKALLMDMDSTDEL